MSPQLIGITKHCFKSCQLLVPKYFQSGTASYAKILAKKKTGKQFRSHNNVIVPFVYLCPTISMESTE